MGDPNFSLHVGKHPPPYSPNISRTEPFTSVTMDLPKGSERASLVSKKRLNSVLARRSLDLRAQTQWSGLFIHCEQKHLLGVCIIPQESIVLKPWHWQEGKVRAMCEYEMVLQENNEPSKLDLLLSEGDKITSFDALYHTAFEPGTEHRVLEYIVERLAQSRIRGIGLTFYDSVSFPPPTPGQDQCL